MAAVIRVLDEQEIDGEAQGLTPDANSPEAMGVAKTATHPAFAGPSSPVPEIDPRIVQAFALGNARLQAVETTLASVPQAATLLRALLAALGVRILTFFALLGAMGLAIPAILWPDWLRISTLGGYAVLVYLPLAALAYFQRGN